MTICAVLCVCVCVCACEHTTSCLPWKFLIFTHYKTQKYSPLFHKTMFLAKNSNHFCQISDFSIQNICIMLVRVLVTQSYLTLCNPITITSQPPLSMEFSRQEYKSRQPFPLQRIYLTQRLKFSLLCLLHCRKILYHSTTREAPKVTNFHV